MRLYCAELYKLLCRKFFLISSVLVLGLLFVYFWFVNVGDERSVVDGQVYTGIQAVRTDREITKEYAGTLTDRKAKEIIDEYGFPSEVEEYYGGFRDENYLNGFVTEQLGNGYMRDWEDYEISTALYPMEQTELGKAARITGEDILFDYTGGWSALLDTLQMGMILGSILILIGVSPVFAEERQNKTEALLLTSAEGRDGDVRAKTAAAFTLAALVYFAVALFIFLAVGAVYGFSGSDCMLGLVKGYYLNVSYTETMTSVGGFAALILVLDFLALNTLCAVTICVSACFRTTFHAVVVSCAVWIGPVLFRIICRGGGYLFMAGTPLFLVMPGVVLDIYRVLFIPVSVAVGILVICMYLGLNRYSANAI